MPRTRRYIFNTLTVVSLLLLLATVGLWVDGNRSYATMAWCCSKSWCVETDSSWFGVLMWWKAENLAEPTWGIARDEFASHNAMRPASGVLYQFYQQGRSKLISGFGWSAPPGGGYGIAVLIPHWFLTLVFTVLPGVWFIKWRKRRKLALVGSCPSCGYDLTGNETGVCPECGVPLEPDATKA